MPSPASTRSLGRLSAQRLQFALLGALVFAVDTTTATDVVISMLYVVIVILAMRTGRRLDVAVTGAASAALTAVSFLATADYGRFLGADLLNGTMSVLAIACVTLLCLRTMRAQAQLRLEHNRMMSISRGMSMTEMAAAIAHEVTQPLAAIGANAGAAGRWLGAVPPNLAEAKAASARIVEEVARASEVVRRLRTVVSGQPIDPTRFDLVALLGQLIEQHRSEIDQAAVGVSVEGPARFEIVADRVLIQQVLANALSNALEASAPAEGAHGTIAFGLEASAGAAVVTVADTGVGLGENAIERIFDPFYTTKHGKQGLGRGGLGIGLAVSRTIVEAHGGVIAASANRPRGLRITIRLPQAIP